MRLPIIGKARMDCPTCGGDGQVIVLKLTHGKHLGTRKCPGCNGKGYLTR